MAVKKENSKRGESGKENRKKIVKSDKKPQNPKNLKAKNSVSKLGARTRHVAKTGIGKFNNNKKINNIKKNLHYVPKIPAYVILGLDYAFNLVAKKMKQAGIYADTVMFKPIHHTRFYKWYKGLADSPRLAFWVLIFTFFWILSGSFGGPPRADKSISDEARTVQTRILQAENYRAIINVSGVTEADNRVAIRAQTSGTVQEILKPKGSLLEANEPFLALDNKIREAEFKQAQASYNQKSLENRAARSLAQGGYQSQVRATEVQAAFARAEADLERARYNLEKSRFSAPFAGKLVGLSLGVGDSVSPGAEVGIVIDLNPIKIKGYVSQNEVVRLSGLGEIDVMIDDKTYRGQLDFISSSANARTRSFEVEVTVPNENEEILDGIPSNLLLPQKQQEAHFISSGWLTLNSQGNVGVHVVNGEGVVDFHPIEIIEDTGAGVWVTGMPYQVNLITVGQEAVVAGEKVDTVKDETNPLKAPRQKIEVKQTDDAQELKLPLSEESKESKASQEQRSIIIKSLKQLEQEVKKEKQ